MPNRYSPTQGNQEEATTPPPSGAGDGEVLLTVQEAARRLRIGRTTLYQYLMSGELESVQIGTRRFVPADAAAAFLIKLRQQPHQPQVELASTTLSSPGVPDSSDSPQSAGNSPDSVAEVLQFLALVEGRSVAWADVRPRRHVSASAELRSRFREALASDQLEVA